MKELSNFWLGIVKLKNEKHLKKESKELMPIAWHPQRWWNFCMKDNKQKEIEPIFYE